MFPFFRGQHFIAIEINQVPVVANKSCEDSEVYKLVENIPFYDSLVDCDVCEGVSFLQLFVFVTKIKEIKKKIAKTNFFQCYHMFVLFSHMHHELLVDNL